MRNFDYEFASHGCIKYGGLILRDKIRYLNLKLSGYLMLIARASIT